VIDSGKKSGHTTLSLTRNGHRHLHVYVEVKHIMGIFIDNSEGFISIEPHSHLIVPFYLQDSTGRLFITPLEHLETEVYSSNHDILAVALSPEGDSLQIKSGNQGLCIVSVYLPGRNLIDSIVVSVGSAIMPGTHVQVLTHGTVQYSSASVQDKWAVEH
jgi:hypothetical protein